MSGLRILGAVRLSRLTDETTSPERQREQIELTAKARGDGPVTIVEDLDVSGAVSPFDREHLGPYLTKPELIATWDALCVAKLDRLTRSVRDFALMVEWCKEHGKSIISVSEGIDFGSSVGKLIAQVLVMFAEFERDRMSERRREAAASLAVLGRWGAGAPPFGYQTIENVVGEGFIIVPEPVTAAAVETIVHGIINDGWTLAEGVRWLNSNGVKPQRSKSNPSANWTTTTLQRILTSRKLLGEIQLHGQAVRDGEGRKVRFDPIIKEDTWQQLQGALQARTRPTSGRRRNASLLLQVAFCTCGAAFHLHKTKGGMKEAVDYYQCSAGRRGGSKRGETAESEQCRARMIRMETLNEAVTDSLLAVHGNTDITRRVVLPASDSSADLAEIEQALDDLEGDRYERGLFEGTAGAQRYAKIIKRLHDRRDEVALLPHEEAKIIFEPTGQTVTQRWQTLTERERGDMLRELAVRVTAAKVNGVLDISIAWGDLEKSRQRLLAVAS